MAVDELRISNPPLAERDTRRPLQTSSNRRHRRQRDSSKRACSLGTRRISLVEALYRVFTKCCLKIVAALEVICYNRYTQLIFAIRRYRALLMNQTVKSCAEWVAAKYVADYVQDITPLNVVSLSERTGSCVVFRQVSPLPVSTSGETICFLSRRIVKVSLFMQS